MCACACVCVCVRVCFVSWNATVNKMRHTVLIQLRAAVPTFDAECTPLLAKLDSAAFPQAATSGFTMDAVLSRQSMHTLICASKIEQTLPTAEHR